MRKFSLSLFISFCWLFVVQAQELPVSIRPLGKPINTKKYTEYAPTLSADGQILVFQSDKNLYRIWYLYESRLQKNGKWSKPQPIEAINNFGQKPGISNGFQTDFIAAPYLSADGNTLYFCATFPGGMGKRDLYVAKRNSNGNWGKPVNIGIPINSNASEDFPSVSPEGDALYFARPNGTKKLENGCYDLWVSKKDYATGNWQKPKKLPKGSLNTGCEKCPRIQADGLTLVFSSLREEGKGSFDLYKAVLGVKEAKWEQVAPVNELNTAAFDQFVTVAGNKVYYNSQGKKTPDIFEASPVPASLQLQKVIDVRGSIFATIDNTRPYPISQARLKVYLLEEGRKPYLLKTLKADNTTGGFALSLRFGYNYRLEATAQGYEPAEKTLRLQDWSALNYRLKKPLLLKKINKTGNGSDIRVLIGREVDKENPKASSKSYLLMNTKTGEVISLAGLKKRAKEENKKNATGKTLATKEELMKAFPLYRPYSTKTLATENVRTLTKIKFPPLHFAYKSSKLSIQSLIYLNNVLKLLQARPTLQLYIEAHTDNSGTWLSNLQLSKQRAEAVKAYLIKNNINQTRLLAKGFGESRPLGINPAKNRRVELILKRK